MTGCYNPLCIGSNPLPSSTSLPTSEELAEIFGRSDDEDDDFPLPLSDNLQMSLPTECAMEIKKPYEEDTPSLFLSASKPDSSMLLGSLEEALTLDKSSEQAPAAKKQESKWNLGVLQIFLQEFSTCMHHSIALSCS